MHAKGLLRGGQGGVRFLSGDLHLRLKCVPKLKGAAFIEAQVDVPFAAFPR